MNKILLTGAIVIAIIGGVLWYTHEPAQEPTEVLGGTAATMGEPIDIIGTSIATTTTYEYFNAYTEATTTAVKRIGAHIDTLTFFLDAMASTTVHGAVGPVYVSILGSNDQQCDTASTTTSMPNQSILSEIRWFDIGTNLLNLAGSATLPAGTSTMAWSGYGTDGRTQIVLTNVNTKCIAFQANASTTDLNVQMMTKSKLFR